MGNSVTREDNLVSRKGKNNTEERRQRKKRGKEINSVTIKLLTVLTANPQIHKHTEGVFGIKAFN